MRNDRTRVVSSFGQRAWNPGRLWAAILLGVLLAFASGPLAKADGGGDMGHGSLAFSGQVESLPSSGLIGDWKVSGKTVHVGKDTEIDQEHGAVAVGSSVMVEGALQTDGSINATKIEVKGSTMPPMGKEVTFAGAIGALPSTTGWIGEWTVGHVTVHVDASTTIDQEHGSVALGAMVIVKGVLQTDGSVNATSIEVKPAPEGPKRTIDLCGAIEKLPTSGLIGDWTVSGVTVHVSASTTVDETRGKAEVKATVRVKGQVQPDLSINANEIVVKDGTCGGFKVPSSAKMSVLHLKRTTDAPEDAEGVVITRALTFADGSVRKDLKVSVEHLLPRTSYDVMIDSFNAGPIMTNGEGEGNLFLSTADTRGAEPLPSELQDFDTLKQVDVAASGGTVVLTGMFADAKTTDRDHPGPDYAAVAILRDASSTVLGMAALTIKEGEQDLVLSVWGLQPGGTYALVIDATNVGSLTASNRGRVEAEYSTNPTGHELPLPSALDPVSALIHVELQDSGGTTVVSGDFQTVDKTDMTILKKLSGRRLHH